MESFPYNCEKSYQVISDQGFTHTEIIQLICTSDLLTGFYMCGIVILKVL